MLGLGLPVMWRGGGTLGLRKCGLDAFSNTLDGQLEAASSRSKVPSTITSASLFRKLLLLFAACWYCMSCICSQGRRYQQIDSQANKVEKSSAANNTP